MPHYLNNIKGHGNNTHAETSTSGDIDCTESFTLAELLDAWFSSNAHDEELGKDRDIFIEPSAIT